MTAGETRALAQGVSHWLNEEDKAKAEWAKATGGRAL